jgi:predicted DNA-binding protein (MmcQ/YjbR family)
VNLDQYNKFCEALQGVSHVVQWGDAHVWKVGGKVFAIGGWSKSKDLAVSFKVSENHFNLLKDQSGFRPAPYLASRNMKWIQQVDTSKARESELKYYIKESYRIVSLGLTKKLQKELGLNQT